MQSGLQPYAASANVSLALFHFYLYWLLPLASSHSGVFNLYKLPFSGASPSNNFIAEVHLQFFPLPLNLEAWRLCLPTTPRATAAIPTQSDGPISAHIPVAVWLFLPLSDSYMLDAWTVN